MLDALEKLWPLPLESFQAVTVPPVCARAAGLDAVQVEHQAGGYQALLHTALELQGPAEITVAPV